MKATKPLIPENVLASALTYIESASIREWAQNERNKPHVLATIAAAINAGRAESPDYPQRLATLLMSIAIGL